MRIRLMAGAAVALGCLVFSAAAAEGVIKGVYLSEKELCAQAKKDTLQSVIEAGNLILSDRGLESVEYNCAFLQMLRHPRMQAGWVATAMCEEPGFAYPEMFSITERTPGELEIAAMSELGGQQAVDGGSDEEQPGAGGGTAQPGGNDGEAGTEDGDVEALGVSGTYYLCEGVALP